jgi:Transposase IS66 family
MATACCNACRTWVQTNAISLALAAIIAAGAALARFGVEPTNNHVERGLRGAVIYRKLSLGSQSERGERTIERLLSASITCRLRRQSLFAYLTQAFATHAAATQYPHSPDRTG